MTERHSFNLPPYPESRELFAANLCSVTPPLL